MRKEYLATYFVADLPPEGLPERFGVITAYNPDGQLALESENVQADAKLKDCLETAKLCYFRVTGGSRDGSHVEPGFGIMVDDPKEIAKLAQRFQQEAFFWIQDTEIFCVKVGEPTMHHVGAWPERWLGRW